MIPVWGQLGGRAWWRGKKARGPVPSVGIIGAGMSGLACALALQEAGYRVRVLDKGRAPGGRMATRLEGGGREVFGFEDAPYRFDHGAQYITARDPDFIAAVERWTTNGVMSDWNPVIRTFGDAPESAGSTQVRHVGIGGMHAIGRHLAFDLDLILGAEIPAPVEKIETGWQLGDYGVFDILVVTAPAPQTTALLANVPELARDAAKAALEPCWATMAAFDSSLDCGFDAAFFNDDPILAWAARETSKPDTQDRTKTASECWTLHARPDWSAEHLESDPDVAKHHLLNAFLDRIDRKAEPAFLKGHRWRYAKATTMVACGFDADALAGFCGDWAPAGGTGNAVAGGRVEDAFLSGQALAAEIIEKVPV